jgi:hypothetical protein
MLRQAIAMSPSVYCEQALREVIRTDGSNPFAYHTMTERLPAVVAAILQYNPDFDHNSARTLTNLASALRDNGQLPSLDLPAPDYDTWAEFWEGHEYATWLNTDWFAAEMYFYRQVLSAVHWWETTYDPYAPLKRSALLDPILWQWIGEAEDASLAELWALSLQGNRHDLCHACQHNHTSWSMNDLLIDERALIEDHLFHTPGDIHYVCDNTGVELAMDLCLVARLLQCTSATIYLHVKMMPTLVSDATKRDVVDLLALLDMSCYRRLAAHLRALIQSHRLRIVPDLFWNGPDAMAALPARLGTMFARSALVVLKGDMNYRRLVGDLLGPCDIPLEQVIAEFPAPVAVLRILKSDPLFGFNADRACTLDVEDATWRTNGKRGLIQFCKLDPPL